MALTASCPRCPSPLEEEGGVYRCATHGVVAPWWRPEIADYQHFAEVLGRLGEVPTYLPWPMSPGWSIADFGCVGDGTGPGATNTTTAGTSDLDGAVQVTVIAEDPGIGLGARCSGSVYDDPGGQVGVGPPAVKVRAAGRQVPLWSVDVEAGRDELLSRSVFAGEADGRWLWLVLQPASAALLLSDEWLLADVRGFGPEALEMPFGGPRPEW